MAAGQSPLAGVVSRGRQGGGRPPGSAVGVTTFGAAAGLEGGAGFEPSQLDVGPGQDGAPPSLWLLTVRAVFKNKVGLTGIGLIVFLSLFCFVGPLVYPTNQVDTNVAQAFDHPSLRYLLGTNGAGFNEFGRLMYGGQTSIEIGVAAAFLATVIAIFYGATSGFIGGAVDAIMMRIVDVLMTIPTFFLLLFLATVIRYSAPVLILILSVLAWLAPARLVRGEALTLRVREYVLAAKALGASNFRIIRRHIIPNAVGTIIVNATFQVADSILALAALSFLGLGIAPPAANWGGMLSNGVEYTFRGFWWLIYPPGIALVLAVLGFNFIGDALRDALDNWRGR